MNTIALNGDQVTISITGWDKVFSLKGEVTFPKTSITNVYAFDDSLSPPWLRNPGTAFPGIIIAGTYQNLGDRKEFWCTHFKGHAIVIDLDHEAYTRIVVDLSDPGTVEAWVAKLAP